MDFLFEKLVINPYFSLASMTPPQFLVFPTSPEKTPHIDMNKVYRKPILVLPLHSASHIVDEEAEKDSEKPDEELIKSASLMLLKALF